MLGARWPVRSHRSNCLPFLPRKRRRFARPYHPPQQTKPIVTAVPVPEYHAAHLFPRPK